MSELVARTGRQQQRYEDGYRLIAGYVPPSLISLSLSLICVFFVRGACSCVMGVCLHEGLC